MGLARGLGRALESAIKEEVCARRQVDGGGRHLLMNTCRRDVLSALSLRPCIGVSGIACDVRVNANTVRWHLDRLMGADYVQEMRLGRHRIFYPQGLLRQEEVRVFHVLNRKMHRDLLLWLVERSGSSVSELARDLGSSRQSVSRRLDELERIGVVSRMSDGGRSRHYLTGYLTENGDGFYKRSKGYIDFMLRRFREEEGDEPVVVKRGLDRVVIELGPRSSRHSMVLGINPYLTVF